jgi:predicted metal-dependent HD superfamily phosphohydrolase
MPNPIIEKHWRNIASEHAPSAWPFLTAAFAEPQRAYHTLDHIVELLEGLERFASLATRPDLLAAAIFWHDSVYVTREADGRPRPDFENVRASGAAFLRRSRFADSDARAVHDIIMATADHIAASATNEYYPGFSDDLDLMCDLDLGSFAAPPAVFDANFDKIRFEFNWAPWSDFLRGRLNFFERLTAPGVSIYRRAETKAAFDTAARANLSRWIPKLHAMLSETAAGAR